MRQLRKGLRKLAPYLPTCEGIDTARLYRDAAAALEQVEAGGQEVSHLRIHGPAE
jgi:hypothetical protein